MTEVKPHLGRRAPTQGVDGKNGIEAGLESVTLLLTFT